MALFKICRGAETNLPTTLTSGYCYFCTDTTNFYIDYTDTYGALTRAKIASKYADKLRYTEDGNFIELDPTDIVTKSNYETAIGVATSDKNGLMSSSDKTKLDGVESGAQVNVQADYSQNDTTTADYIKNRTHYSKPYTAIPSVEPVDLLQHSIGDIIRLDNQVNSGAIIMRVINSLGTQYGGVRAAIRETTYNTDFKKVVTHDWDCSDINVTIEEIGHNPTYEGLCNKLCHIARGSVELYAVYFIAYPAYLNDEYKTQFPGVGIYLKYVAKPGYASQYLNVSLVVTQYHSLSQHYLPLNVEYTANRVIAISAESDDTHYPTAKAVYDALPTIVSTDSNGLMSSVDKSKLDGIEAGAQVNVQADWNQSDKTAPDYIKNRIGWWDYSRLQFVIGYCTDPIEDADLTSTYPGYTYWYGISSWFGGNTSSPLDLSYPCTLIGFEDFVVDEWKKITPSDTDENWGQVVVGDRSIIVIAEGGKITKIGSKTIWSDSYNHRVKFVQYDGERNPISLDLIRKTDFVTEGDPRLITSQGVKRYVDKYGQKVTIKTWTSADMT